jgi:hypothetical protein
VALTVTRSRVKEKLGITDTSRDVAIDNLILELLPVVTFAVTTEAIEDTGNTGLQSTLNLGTTEVVAGEAAAQFAREFGATESVTIGDLSLTPHPCVCGDPTGLLARGWRRLRPYLKDDPAGRQRVSQGAHFEEA